MFALVNCRLLASERGDSFDAPQLGKAVLVHGCRIVAVVQQNSLSTDWPGCRIFVDLHNDYLAPGLIDLQVFIVLLMQLSVNLSLRT